MRQHQTTATLIGALMLSALLVADAHAQRGGGGGRGGVASSGSFSASSATASTNSGNRPSQLPAKPGQLPSDGRGDWDAGSAVVAGAVVGAAAARRGYGASGPYYYEPMTTLPCTPKEISAGSVKYYQCGSDFFMQTYDGGTVVYVQVDPPPQY